MRYVLVLALVAAVGGCGGGSPAHEDAGADATHDAAPDAAPDAPSCTSACSAGQTQCAADGSLVTCVVDAHGCGSFPTSGGTACGAHQTCVPDASACTCNTDASCALGSGSFCDSGNASFTTCTTDAQGCVYSTGATSCTNPTTCAAAGSGSAACVCPAIGTAAGDGCATENATACGSSDILTCQMVGGCLVWVDTGSCSGVGLTCAASGNGATCVCPPAPGPTFIADPNATPIVVSSATIAPTGVASPTGCRFPKLGSAVAAAQMYVIANGAPATAKIESASSGSFAAETWPIVVPASVTVTSDDAAATPSRYTLAPGNGQSAAIVDGGGALGAVAISVNLTATGSPAAVTLDGCTSTAPSVTIGPVAITFAANATGDGIHIADPTTGNQACAATITGATITGAYEGISVSSTAGAAPTTATATITGSTITGSRDAGLLVYQTSASGVQVSGSTIAGSVHAGAFLDTATLSAHTGSLSITGTLGTTTITNSATGAIGVEVNNNTVSGQARSGAVLHLTDVTIDGSGGASGDGINLHGATATLLGADISANQGNQLTAVACDITMNNDATGHACLFDGGGVGKAGILVDAATTLTANDIVAENNPAWGVDVRDVSIGQTASTQVTLTDCVIQFNTGGGLSHGGLSVTGNDASDTSSVTISGGRFASNSGHGIAVFANGSVTISGAAHADSNGGSGLFVSGSTATAKVLPGTSAPTFTGNTRPGVVTSGSTTLDGTASAPVQVMGNQNDGIDVTDGTFEATHLNVLSNADTGMFLGGSSLAFTMTSSTISNNSLGGIAINHSHGVANAAQLTSCTVSSNGGSGQFGIVLQGSRVPTTGASTVITSCTVTGNGIGIGVGANTPFPVSADLESNTIESNSNVGILYGSTATTNAVTVNANRVEGNGMWGIGSSQVGGVGLMGVAPAMLKFSNNIVGNNGGNQVAAYLNSSANARYDLSAGGNQLVNCTPTSGFFALYLESPSPGVLTVDADNNTWADTTFPGTNVVTSGNTSVSTLNATGGAACPGP